MPIAEQEMLNGKESTMFDLNLMDHFYNPDYETDQAVVDAWYTYVLKFLPLVNKKWREATAPDKIVNSVSMFQFITISDEALMRWFMQILLPIEIKKIEDKKSQDQKESEEPNNKAQDENKKKTSKRGPHDTNVKAPIYAALHHAITNARRNYNAAVRWNLIFWDEVKKRNLSILKNGTLSSKITKNLSIAMDLPLPDLNENQEFLASYSIAKGMDTSQEHNNDNASVTEPTNVTPM